MKPVLKSKPTNPAHLINPFLLPNIILAHHVTSAIGKVLRRKGVRAGVHVRFAFIDILQDQPINVVGRIGIGMNMTVNGHLGWSKSIRTDVHHRTHRMRSNGGDDSAKLDAICAHLRTVFKPVVGGQITQLPAQLNGEIILRSACRLHTVHQYNRNRHAFMLPMGDHLGLGWDNGKQENKQFHVMSCFFILYQCNHEDRLKIDPKQLCFIITVLIANNQNMNNKTPAQIHHDMIMAIKYEEMDQIDNLMCHPSFNPFHEDSEILRKAAEQKNAYLVELFIPITNPLDLDSLALRWACEKIDNLECIKLLIPHSNPKDQKSAALRLAVMYGNIEGARMLIPVSNPDDALHDLQTRNYPYGLKDQHPVQVLQDLVTEYEAHQTAKTITAAIDQSQAPTAFKKKI